ncbi:hypothetical protein CEUSTIGMA_g3207.t1 [Chlamydomonas eustigma]|uniref:Uncharacterized protein n=1 Tax=Chlamydomonas eustigma TaxID=1157962 RepID=A0A250WY43_9CHLO|nr:hypothetical protein CEUSTIGMA_g3207.t1 [Chlamydomonas eustigma]|eukprot:GAX75764.1 hypothetical protein CEUSTIGMA_g3207.t1 [Chlamydomonas eustigma]
MGVGVTQIVMPALAEDMDHGSDLWVQLWSGADCGQHHRINYLYDQFGLTSLVTAGGLGVLFGLMNLFSRASGGMLSDLVAVPYGMRGRLWLLWVIQSLSGAFCIGMAYVNYSLRASIGLMIIFSIFCQQ